MCIIGYMYLYLYCYVFHSYIHVFIFILSCFSFMVNSYISIYFSNSYLIYSFFWKYRTSPEYYCLMNVAYQN